MALATSWRRLLVVLVPWAAIASADPAGSPRPAAPSRAPDPWAEHVPANPAVPPPGDPRAGAPGFGGGWAAGQVITPPAHADMAPYPRGMVITPPDPGDDMVIPRGGRGLAERHLPRQPLSKQLGDGIHRGLELGMSALTELLRPPRSI